MSGSNKLIVKDSKNQDFNMLKDKKILDEFHNSYDALKKELIRIPGFAKAIHELSDGSQDGVYRIILPNSVKEKIKDGNYAKVFDKENNLFIGNIKDQKTGEIVKKARFEELESDKLEKIGNALTAVVMQATLNEILNQLENANRKINILIKGQHSDRIAEVKSGIELYENAVGIANENRIYALENALQTLSNGRRKLLESINNKTNEEVKPPKSLFQQIISIKDHNGKWLNELETRYNMIVEAVNYSIIATKYITLIKLETNRTLKNIQRDINKFQRELSSYINNGERICNYLPYSEENSPEDFFNEVNKFTLENLTLDRYQNIELEFKRSDLLYERE